MFYHRGKLRSPSRGDSIKADSPVLLVMAAAAGYEDRCFLSVYWSCLCRLVLVFHEGGKIGLKFLS